MATDEPIDGPDPNDVRRHAKKMHTEMQYRMRYRRIDYYRPNLKQLAFHNNDSTELMLRAGNQCGKTHAAGAQMTMDALSLYPEWYKGRRFVVPPKIERPVDFLGWSACTTAEKCRDGAQLKLLGQVGDNDGLGTGLIPLDNIVGRPTMSRGISNFVDGVTLRRETGGKALVQFKTYAQGREVFQGSPVDVNWLDEDVSRDNADIYGECLARRITTRGRIISSLTPLLGLSPLRKRFKERAGQSMDEILMTIWDAAVSNGGHIPDEDIPGIIADLPASERETRAFGVDMQGQGTVFETPLAQIKHNRDPAEFPSYWSWMWGLDFRHSGSATTGHPFAAALGCWDRDNDCIYVVDTVKMLGLAPLHVIAMKRNPMWMAPVAWPHDGGKGASIISGETIKDVYRKLGLNMLPSCATHPQGGYDFEGGITIMENRFANGGLKIAAHLTEALDEYQGYHRVNGLVNKVDDDIMSAIRILCMDIRRAKSATQFQQAWLDRRDGSTAKVAENVDFDCFA